MSKRFIYAALFGVPGFFIAALAVMVVGGLAAGVVWLWVFGDNPWPKFIETGLAALVLAVFLCVWLGIVAAGFLVGRKLENRPGLDRRHVWIAMAATVFPLLMIAAQLWGDRLGPRTDNQRCFDFCLENGYSASSTPPEEDGQRMCGCLNENGVPGLRAPLDEIDAPR